MSPGFLAGRRTGKWVTLVDWGFKPAVCTANQRISVFFYNRKERPLRISEATPLYCPLYGKWRHVCPRDLECTPCRHPCRAIVYENCLVVRERAHGRRRAQAQTPYAITQPRIVIEGGQTA
jgi:hypothetical protein